jgi:hypothetical protein
MSRAQYNHILRTDNIEAVVVKFTTRVLSSYDFFNNRDGV